MLPEEIPLWERLEGTARGLARLRGYREIRPALLEETDLFTRSVGEVTDIVEKEMFTIPRRADGKGPPLSLRPEGTAGIVRAYLQAGYARTQPVQRLFHVGPMFRYERPQKGRERMFTQFDVEALGSLDPRLDAEVIHLAVRFFAELGFSEKDLKVRMNSMGDGDDRDRWREALRDWIRPKLDQLCELCRNRFERNVLRILDCKNPSCRAALAAEPGSVLPQPVQFLSPGNEEHLKGVQRYLEELDVQHYVSGDLVRGLDYYTRTVFEVHYPPLGSRSALCGGGRYDHLVRDLGGPDLGAVGFAIGFTPTMLAMEELGLAGEVQAAPVDAFVAAAGEGIESEVFALAEMLRGAGVAAVYDVEGKTLKAQMKAAGKGGYRFAVVIGPDELERGTVQLKDLERGEQEEVPRGELAPTIGARIAARIAARIEPAAGRPAG